MPMKSETLQALTESIAHWKRMREFGDDRITKGESPFSEDCALCKRFVCGRCCLLEDGELLPCSCQNRHEQLQGFSMGSGN